MPRNVEIKARVADLAEVESRLAGLDAAGPVSLEQEDVFYDCTQGRLKLRRLDDGTGELIAYERPDRPGPATSRYVRYPTRDPALLAELLGTALGERGVVRKRRRLFTVGRTRVHLDRIEGLGSFVELEVVLDDEQSEAEGERIARELMKALGIREDQLVDAAYVDLLSR